MLPDAFCFGATLWLCRPYGTRFLFLSPLTRPSRAALPHHCSASTPTLTASGDSVDTFSFETTRGSASLRDSVPLSLASDAVLKGRSSTSLFRFNPYADGGWRCCRCVLFRSHAVALPSYGTRVLFLSPLTRPSRAALPHHCSASTPTLTAGGDAADAFCFEATLWLCHPYGTRFLFLSPLTRPPRAALPHHCSASTPTLTAGGDAADAFCF